MLTLPHVYKGKTNDPFLLHTFTHTALVLPGMYESSQPLSRVGYRPEALLLSLRAALLKPLRESLSQRFITAAAPIVQQDSSGEMPRAWGRDMAALCSWCNLSSTPSATWQLPNPIPLCFHRGRIMKYRGWAD